MRLLLALKMVLIVVWCAGDYIGNCRVGVSVGACWFCVLVLLVVGDGSRCVYHDTS